MSGSSAQLWWFATVMSGVPGGRFSRASTSTSRFTTWVWFRPESKQKKMLQGAGDFGAFSAAMKGSKCVFLVRFASCIVFL